MVIVPAPFTEPPITLSPAFFRDARASPGNHGFVYSGLAFFDYAVGGYFFTCTGEHALPDGKLLQGHLPDASVRRYDLVRCSGRSSAIFCIAFPAFITAFISIQCPSSIMSISVASSPEEVHRVGVAGFALAEMNA